MHKPFFTKDIMHKMSTTVHKSTPSKIVANLKNHRHAADGSTNLNKNQNEPA